MSQKLLPNDPSLKSYTSTQKDQSIFYGEFVAQLWNKTDCGWVKEVTYDIWVVEQGPTM